MRRLTTILAVLTATSALLVVGIVFLLSQTSASAEREDARQWTLYKERFLTADGRVVDTGNRGITHSEGQGWGMIFAQTFDDREAFDRIWGWTSRWLQWRGSSLFAWKWEGDRVPDPNNATDGDLLIAWALDRAATQWQVPAYADAARRIAGDVRRLLVTKAAERPVLLPAFDGFDKEAGVTLNLSYYVFPAFEAMRRLDGSDVWERLERAGLDLLTEGRFGRWGLPADWMTVAADGTLAPADGWPPRFGFDAVRIPLYLVWSGNGTPERLAPYRAFWGQFDTDRQMPSWAGLETDDIGPPLPSQGFRSIAELVRPRTGAVPVGDALPGITPADDYYSSSLVLLTRVAAREMGGARL